MRAAAGKGRAERGTDWAGGGGVTRTLERPRGRSGGQMDKVKKPQGQALAATHLLSLRGLPWPHWPSPDPRTSEAKPCQ